MNIILKKEYFDHNKINIKIKPKKNKITYRLNNAVLLGIPIQITEFNIQKICSNIMYIDIKESPDKFFLYEIDYYFYKTFNHEYKSFIVNDSIKVKIFDTFDKDKNNLYISFKNIIKVDSSLVVQIFSII